MIWEPLDEEALAWKRAVAPLITIICVGRKKTKNAMDLKRKTLRIPTLIITRMCKIIMNMRKHTGPLMQVAQCTADIDCMHRKSECRASEEKK
jgi:hypothetical protein